MDNQPNNPLHGVKLADIVEHLVEAYGWEQLGAKININCFNSNPSVKSSLKFLRKTPWAREKVERLYLRSIGKQPPRKRQNAKPEDVKKQNSDVGSESTNPTEANPAEAPTAKESPWEAARRNRESRG